MYVNDQHKADAQLSSMLKESLTLQQIISLLLVKNYKRKKFKDILKIDAKYGILYNVNIEHVSKSTALGISFIMLSIMGLGCFLIIMNEMEIGELIAYLVLMSNIGNIVTYLTMQYPTLIKAISSLKRIEHFISAHKKHRPQTGLIDIPPVTNSITLNDVSVCIDNTKILSGINLSITMGKSVAIVGASGSGKTTLLNLLLCEFSPSSGCILVDGIDLQTVSLKSWYSQIGVVPQHSDLFTTTIKENIALGKLNASLEDVIKAAKAAEIHDDIIALPDGYDTIVNQNVHLSDGQRQRITIARALIANKKILLLDEATSALDPINAASLNKTFDKLKGTVTLVSITHYLPSVINMDLIYALNKGKLVEAGTHEELIQQKKFYSQLWKKQKGMTITDNSDRSQIAISCLNSVPIFRTLNNDVLTILSNEFNLERIESGNIVIEEGDHADKFYIIISGIVEVSKLNQQTNTQLILGHLSEGDYFGEIALLFDTPRKARIMTEATCIFLVLQRDQFKKIFSQLPRELQAAIINKAKKIFEADKSNPTWPFHL